jgi:hypothetical protein
MYTTITMALQGYENQILIDSLRIESAELRLGGSNGVSFAFSQPERQGVA